jgi:hypothetical protein
MKRRSLLKAETTSTRMTISTATKVKMRARKRTAPLRRHPEHRLPVAIVDLAELLAVAAVVVADVVRVRAVVVRLVDRRLRAAALPASLLL